jgi:dTDP-4-dehydrorhamnose reductase
MKKIFLIGKDGQLGSEIVQCAEAFSYHVSAFSKKELDVLNFEFITKKIQELEPDILINTSAYHVMSECEENPQNAMAVNFLAVAHMARVCKQYGVRFITFSTDYIFNGKKGSPYIEDDMPDPLQMYGISKLAGEYACTNYYPEGACVIRTCGLYGGKAGSPAKGGNFVLNMLKEGKEKDMITVSSDQIISPTYAGDLSKGVLELLQREEAVAGVYHLVNEGYCSWYEFTKEIFRMVGMETDIVPVKRGERVAGVRRPLFSALKNIKAQSLGVELPDWREGLRSYLKFLAK